MAIPYGFEKMADGNVRIVVPEIEVVQRIYQHYVGGASLGGIAAELETDRVIAPSGNAKWSRSVIDKILSNGKYVPFAIPMELFVAVQFEKGARTNTQTNSDGSTQRKTTRYSSRNVLSGLLVCAECGSNYRRITRPNGEVVWRCADRAEKGKRSVCKQSLSLYENNGNKPEYERGRMIASALQFPYEYFLQEDECKTATEVTYFRSLASATKMGRAPQSIKLEYVAKMYEILLEYIDFPPLNIPQISFIGNDDEFDCVGSCAELEEIEQIALQVRNHWKLGDGPILDVQFTLEENGIIVTGFDTHESKIDAFSQRTMLNYNDVYFIAVDQGSKPQGRIRFDMAHELGHILLHPWSESLDLITKEDFKRRETQANIFASSFLLPSESFGKDVQVYPTDLKYYLWLKKKWKSSVQLMVYRSYQLGIISDNQFQYLMRQILKNGWRQKEPDDEPYLLNENVFQGAIDSLAEQKVLSPANLIKEFSRYGVTLYPADIENLLHLRKGTFEIADCRPRIIQLKRTDWDND